MSKHETRAVLLRAYALVAALRPHPRALAALADALVACAVSLGAHESLRQDRETPDGRRAVVRVDASGNEVAS